MQSKNQQKKLTMELKLENNQNTASTLTYSHYSNEIAKTTGEHFITAHEAELPGRSNS